MNVRILFAITASFALMSATITFPQQEAQPGLLLLDLGSEAAGRSIEADQGFTTKLMQGAQGPLLRIETRVGGDIRGVRLRAPAGNWDMSRYLYVAMDVQNRGTEEVLVSCRLQNARWVDGAVVIPPAESRILSVLLKRRILPPHLEKAFPGMNGMPGGFVGIWDQPDLSRIDTLTIAFPGEAGPKAVEIGNVRSYGSYEPPSEARLRGSIFPFVDRFGQYRHATWPGKLESTEDLVRRRRAEQDELAKHPGPADWGTYGGWAKGPKLKATGYFRVEKHQGKWWLVDPEGLLFWSHGITCVRAANGTPITGRERAFEYLPVDSPAASQFYGTGKQAARGYYREHVPYKTYSFDGANLLHKYGDNWRAAFAETTQQRLRSWGMNTIANWSDEAIYLQRKTPYTATLGTGGRRIEGSEGTWGKFPDPFDPGFRQGLQRQLADQKGKSAGDPWCIGYFVDNELSWGDEFALALAVLGSPADQPAKQAFDADLRSKYKTIDKLNAAWGTSHASWDDFLRSRSAPPKDKASGDLVRFNHKLAETYFRICRDSIREAAPNGLYLGCRFDFHFYPVEDAGRDWLVRIAGQFVDVISFNRYRFSARDLVPPKGVDKPLIIGEFHFGALDRGLLHTGLRSVLDQRQRGEIYAGYVRSALENPWMIGTHWFQYGDQPVTGRSDGENYQIGFIDVTDQPYAETVAASRSVGYAMYEHRMQAK